MFKEAAKAIENNPWQEKRKKQVLSNWVVDFSRPMVYDDSARLGNLIAEMNNLDMGDNQGRWCS